MTVWVVCVSLWRVPTSAGACDADEVVENPPPADAAAPAGPEDGEVWTFTESAALSALGAAAGATATPRDALVGAALACSAAGAGAAAPDDVVGAPPTFASSAVARNTKTESPLA